MKKITLRKQMFMLLLMIAGYATAQNPAITELYGRYTFSGDCMLQNATVPAETDYEVALLPGDADGQVKIQGIMGYSGAVNLVYDQENGTLTSPMVDLGDGNPIFPGGMLCGTYMTYYMAMQMTPASFTVAVQDGNIVLTSTDVFMVAIADPDAELTEEEEEEGALAMYAPGVTLTKTAVNKPISEVTGTYNLTSDYIDFMLIDGASENFQLTVTEKDGAENTLVLNGLFGMENASVEAQYMPESGLIVMPMETEMPNGMYFGFSPESQEEQGMKNYNDQPVFFAADNTLSSPSFFILDNGVDEEMEMPLLFTFLRATATKVIEGGSSIHTQTAAGRLNISAQKNTLSVESAEATDIRVFNAQGAAVGTAHASAATFNGLPAGIYIVKAGERCLKIAVK
ncbi:MAG: hypothetical protein NC388_01020 [Clostridium sp.]|nr:hypothetical protein [Clostridium sp.]